MTEGEIINLLDSKKFVGEKWVIKHYPDFHNRVIEYGITNNLDIKYKELYFLYKNSMESLPVCKICDNPTKFINSNKGFRKYCSTKCLSNDLDVKNKIENTCIDRYGYSSPMNNESVKDKLKNTIISRYGVDNISKLDNIKDKKKRTSLNNYGETHFFKTKDMRNKLSSLMQIRSNDLNTKKKINIDNYLTKKMADLNIKYLSSDKSIYECECCNGHIFEIHKNMINDRVKMGVEICTECNKIGGKSENELEILNFVINNTDLEVLHNDRKVLKGKEIDIYIPKLKLAIEYNGLYWHSDKYKNDNYHINKTNLCNSIGIELFHIFEDDWLYKKDIIKSMILNKLIKTDVKIYARKCVIKNVGNKDVREFLINNHLQSFVGSKIKLGLYYNGKIVSLMTFGNLRKNMGQNKEEGMYELLRFCNSLNTNVIGGASKLFKYFVDNYKPDHIITYANRDYSNGNLYNRLGFDIESITKPNFFYVKGIKRYNRFSFRKDILVKEGYDKNMTARDIMRDRGFNRIYNSGNIKFIFNPI